jgi:hypothetical protein
MTSPGTASLRRRFALLLTLFSLLIASCFESPVREDLLLRFLSNGAVVATSTVRIAEAGNGNPVLARRLAEARRAILDGSDSWGPRFAAADPAAERFSWEKRLGELRSATRSAVIAEPAGLEAFFRDTSLSVTYTLDAERGTAELTIVPGVPARATRRQREEMEKTLATWSEQVAAYLETGSDLYRYLEDHPERARPCLGFLFTERLAKKDLETLGALMAEEKEKVDRLDDAMEKVVEVLAVPEGADHSPDEISHLIYDPFPARLTVKLPGAPLAVEGFRPGEGGVLTVSSLGLWDALASLEGRWLSPDPILFYIESARREEETIDLAAFLDKPRQTASAPPSAREVRAALEQRLKPATLYRVSFKVQPEEDSEFHWEPEERP